MLEFVNSRYNHEGLLCMRPELHSIFSPAALLWGKLSSFPYLKTMVSCSKITFSTFRLRNMCVKAISRVGKLIVSIMTLHRPPTFNPKLAPLHSLLSGHRTSVVHRGWRLRSWRQRPTWFLENQWAVPTGKEYLGSRTLKSEVGTCDRAVYITWYSARNSGLYLCFFYSLSLYRCFSHFCVSFYSIAP